MPSNQDTHAGNKKGKSVSKNSEVTNDAVAIPSAAYKSMVQNWQLVSDVIGGTEVMREARETYLHKHAYEGDKAYNERLDQAVLNNETLRTLDTLVGKAFKNPPTFNENINPKIDSLKENVDLEQNALAPFAREWFRAAVKDALCHVLVDFTVAEPKKDGSPRTLADDASQNMRPFWRIITAPEMLGMIWVRENNALILDQIRFMDNQLVSDGAYGEILQERCKVISRNKFEVWTKQTEGSSKKSKWVLTETGENTLGEVPLVTFYTNKTGLGQGRGPLVDLAHLNVRHWQSSSDQNNILTVARFPILAGSGIQGAEADTVTIGPRQFLSVKEVQGKIYYVEHKGAAISAGENDIDKLEKQMAAYGAELVDKTNGPETATGRIIDEGEAISPLQSWGVDFKDALEKVLMLTAKWLKIKPDTETLQVIYEIEPEADLANTEELGALDKARSRRDISRKTYLAELQRRSILPEEFDEEEDREELDSEAPDADGLEGPLGGLFDSNKKPGPPEPKTEE